jgi:hypothetical protein
LVFLFTLVSPAFAQTISHDVTVTATVLPSPEWIGLLQSNSSIYHIDLPFLNFVTYRLRLSDGQSPVKSRLVTMTAENSPVRSVLTDSEGIADFYIPKNLFSGNPEFACLILDQEIPLFSGQDLL